MKYDEVRELGRGGFGIVGHYVGEDGIDYALKSLNMGAFAPADHQTLRRRFEREVRYQERIDHPNVVPVLDKNLDDDPPWFAMPMATGSLADELQKDRTLGGDPKGALFDILAGLEALHEAGFCHRDLKPGNVLRFVEKEGKVTYKISDFGLTTPGAGQTSTLTGTNMGGGTVMYRPPECANNFRRATAMADIYSFGAILHDIFGGGLGRIPHGRLAVPGPLAPIVEKCTESMPRRRYRSVAALREDLFEILDDGDIEFYSQEEEDVISILKLSDELSDDNWDRVFNLLDENADKGVPNSNILRALSRNHILQLGEVAPEMFHALGEMYAEYAQTFSFDFDYCDVISDKAQLFYDAGDVSLKAKIALAMLELGTSHNRWRVEWQFMRMAGPDIATALAERILVEIDVRKLRFSTKMAHIKASIGAGWGQLHTHLRERFEAS